MTSSTSPAEALAVVDASAIVDYLTESAKAPAVSDRLAGRKLAAPAHLDAEVLSAVARMFRAGDLDEAAVDRVLNGLQESVIVRHPIAGLLHGAWTRRGSLLVLDALYVELAVQLGTTDLVTTDDRLARAVDWIEPV